MILFKHVSEEEECLKIDFVSEFWYTSFVLKHKLYNTSHCKRPCKEILLCHMIKLQEKGERVDVKIV